MPRVEGTGGVQSQPSRLEDPDQFLRGQPRPGKMFQHLMRIHDIERLVRKRRQALDVVLRVNGVFDRESRPAGEEDPVQGRIPIDAERACSPAANPGRRTSPGWPAACRFAESRNPDPYSSASTPVRRRGRFRGQRREGAVPHTIPRRVDSGNRSVVRFRISDAVHCGFRSGQDARCGIDCRGPCLRPVA